MTPAFLAARRHLGLSRPGYAVANLLILGIWLVCALLTFRMSVGVAFLPTLAIAAIAWVALSWRRAIEARLKWVLPAPALTLAALVVLAIFGGWGDYAAANSQAPTPAYIWVAGIVFWTLSPIWPLAALALCIVPRRR